MNIDWSDKTILLTGGTGSFGKKFTEVMLSEYSPKVIRIFSRDELKQWEMRKKFNDHPSLRFFVGNIKDKERVSRAMQGVDIVVHAAALKQVPSCEYNPFEAVKTNILGAQNLVDAAIQNNVEKMVAISTDKAVNPVNLYGATKMCMEKLCVAGNSYVGAERKTRISCIRYGNVIGSRGSIIPLLKEQKQSGKVTITDQRMTRFWLTLKQGVDFVIKCIDLMHGGEVFVPRIPSMKITDLAYAVAPECSQEIIGIRPGEKLHECLLTEDEARHSRELENMFVIEPEHPWWFAQYWDQGKVLPEGFRYASDSNEQWLNGDQLKELID